MSQSDSPFGGLGGAGGFDIGALLSQAQALQSQLQEAQEIAANTTVEGVSASGKIRVHMSGTGVVQAVRIDPSIVDPADVELLEDLILAAINDGTAQVAALNQQSMGDMTSGLGLEGLGLGGLGLGGPGGLLG